MDYYPALKKWDLAIWNNMDEPGRHFAKWNNPDPKRKILHNLIYVRNLKEVKYIDAGSRMVVTKGGEMGEMGRCRWEGTKLQLCRMNEVRDLMYSMMTIVNNAVLCTGNLLRE